MTRRDYVARVIGQIDRPWLQELGYAALALALILLAFL